MPPTHLDNAVDALENGDRVAALTSLIDAWRECRAAELEEVIKVVSQDVARILTPLDDSDRTAYDLAWTELEARGRAIDVEHLLPGLWGEPKGSIGLRLLALRERGPDPRVGAGLMRMIKKPPMTARTSWSAWSGIFHVLPDYVDSRARRALKKRAKTHDGEAKFWSRLTRWIEVVLPKLPQPDMLSADAAAHVQGLLARARLLAAGPPQLIADAPPPARPREIDVDDALRGAVDHLELGKLELALQALRTFWAARRSTPIAAVFDRLAALIDKDSQPLAAGTQKALHARWMQLAATPSAAEVGQLLDVLDTGTLKQIRERFGAMKIWAPDPRVAYSVISFLGDANSDARLPWSIVAELLLVHADPRLKGKLTSWKQLNGRDELMTAFERTADLSAAELKLADRIKKVVNKHTERLHPELSAGLQVTQPFIDNILDDPASDGPRLVFADWLTERGDPTGLFISLSIAKANGQKVAGALNKHFRKHELELLGTLGGFMNVDRYERGFPHTANVRPIRYGALNRPGSALEELFGDWRWTTVEDLKAGYGREEGIGVVLQRAPLRSLRRLSACWFNELAAVTQPMPLEWVEIEYPAGQEVDWSRLDRAAEAFFPDVSSLKFMPWGDDDHQVAPPAGLFDTRFGHRLDTIVSGRTDVHGAPPVDVWVKRVYSSGAPIRRIELNSNFTVILERSAGKKRTLALSFDEWFRRNSDEWQIVVDAIGRIPQQAISTTTCAFGFEDDDGRSAPLLQAMSHLKPTIVPWVEPEGDSPLIKRGSKS